VSTPGSRGRPTDRATGMLPSSPPRNTCCSAQKVTRLSRGSTIGPVTRLPAPLTTAAFDGLLAALTEIRDAYAQSEERHRDELEVVESFRYVSHLLSEANDLLVEGDPERPRFSSMVSPTRKFLGDNPDAIYH